MIIGVISDTHGMVRPEALEALAGSDLILHAGDIGSADIIDILGGLAPVVAVRGNNDRGAWADRYGETERVVAAAVSIYLLHDLNELDLSPSAAGIDVVVSGHSHAPKVERIRDVLYLNPGSAGPRRFRLPVTVARLTIDSQGVTAEVIDLFQSAG